MDTQDEDEKFLAQLTDEGLAHVKAKVEAEARKRRPIGSLSEGDFEATKAAVFREKK